jgi:hypothetical protein
MRGRGRNLHTMSDFAESASSMAVIFGASRRILFNTVMSYSLQIWSLTVKYESLLQVKHLFPHMVFAKLYLKY